MNLQVLWKTELFFADWVLAFQENYAAWSYMYLGRIQNFFLSVAMCTSFKQNISIRYSMRATWWRRRCVHGTQSIGVTLIQHQVWKLWWPREVQQQLLLNCSHGSRCVWLYGDSFYVPSVPGLFWYKYPWLVLWYCHLHMLNNINN